jgi:hypothetical protein
MPYFEHFSRRMWLRFLASESKVGSLAFIVLAQWLTSFCVLLFLSLLFFHAFKWTISGFWFTKVESKTRTLNNASIVGILPQAIGNISTLTTLWGSELSFICTCNLWEAMAECGCDSRGSQSIAVGVRSIGPRVVRAKFDLKYWMKRLSMRRT